MLSAIWDQSKLSAAIKQRLQFPGRTEAQIVNTAAFWIAVNAKRLTPLVPVARVDAELGTIVTPRLNSRTGQPLSQKNSRNRILSGGRMGDERKTVTLAKLIVLARANKAGRNRGQGNSTTSNYNVRTNNRFAIPASRLSEMNSLIHRMISARHSATHFLKSGWVRAVKTLRPFAVTKFRRGEGPPLEDARTDHGGQPRGEGIPATEGSWRVSATIENATGMAGTVNAANYNQALMEHGAPALQQAIDIEARLVLDYCEKQLAEVTASAFAGCR